MTISVRQEPIAPLVTAFMDDPVIRWASTRGDRVRASGSELLARGTARADAAGLPAYLEASSRRNRALYERHGFEVTGKIQVTDSPPIWPMLRSPR